MHTVARMLQAVALFVILPAAMIAQLGEKITAGQMLQFLVAGICLFSIGYLMQAYGGAKK
ncbi:MAG: hypothetical protein KF688_00540 [Pirellulales bacterium]|nr:hypothetical protein [Pirellulales bacterium]MBX3432909.1 hypothetical protein [Pirellulales bacterium]